MANVYGMIQSVAAALHVQNGAIFKTALPTIPTLNTDQLLLGHWLIEADRHCGQMSVE